MMIRHEEKLFDGSPLACEAVKMGRDITVAISGGGAPHIGSVVMSEAAERVSGNGITCTSSVLNKAGHKDEVIARMFAEAIAKQQGCTAVCVCGIHIDNLTPDRIEDIRRVCENLLNKLLYEIKMRST